MNALKYPKKSRINLNGNFNTNEFDCPCTQCHFTLIDDELVTKLQSIRETVRLPITITSGYRCKNYQEELRLRGYETAKGTSQHELGKAADIMIEGKTGKDLEILGAKAGFKSIGIGSVFVHLDLRNDKERRWFYTRG